jgi:hypothetical protein
VSGSYLLKPFPADHVPPVKLEAVLRREGDTLLLCYLLRGELAELILPEKTGPPERRDGLWRQTCFELFLAPPEGTAYWEVNLSPSGHWNIYTFADYRAGMRQAPLSLFSFTAVREERSLAVVFSLPLAGLAPPGSRLVAGPTAVLASRSESLSYWALAHPLETGADFHRRESFTVLI